MYASLAPSSLASRAPHAPTPGYAQFLGALPQATVKPYRGPRATLEKMAEHILGDHGERSMLVRQFTEWVVRGVRGKDYLGQILAVRNCLVAPSPWLPGVPLFNYANDPRHVELIKTPDKMVREILEHGAAVVDCDEVTCMGATMLCQIGREVELVAMGFAPGALSHVAFRCKEPKSERWILCDGVAGPREKEAAGKAKELMVYSLD